MSENGYTPMTTFWDDFSIADRFGEKAIIDTYKRAFAEWKHDVKYLTELVLVLNHKIWYYYHNHNNHLGMVYNDLWQRAYSWCCENLKGDDARYYYETTD
jgi:hypothetical protein